jgi:Ca2+/Na+ antiporter
MHQMQPDLVSEKRLKRGGFTGILIGLLAILACELPMILAVVGLGGLSSAAVLLRPHPIVEMVALALLAMGVLMLLLFLYRRTLQR